MHERAGLPAQPDDLIDVDDVVSAYYELVPDPANPAQKVIFGTSGHRGSSLDTAFNEAHIIATTAAIVEYRRSQGTDGVLYIGRDTHALSEPAWRTAIEVLSGAGVTTAVDARGSYTPTPAVSHSILRANGAGTASGVRTAGPGLADGIVITPSHNPPRDGGFKYNPPHGGPAGSDATGWIANRANELLAGGWRDVKRVPVAEALDGPHVVKHDYLDTYLDALQDFPKTDTKIHTERGTASCQKVDIFKRLMWFTYDENPMTWYKLSVDSVKEIIALNKNNERIEELEEYAIVSDLPSHRSSANSDMELLPIEEDSITRFDTPKRRKNKRKKSNKEAQPKEMQAKEVKNVNTEPKDEQKAENKGENNNKNSKKQPKNVNKAAELKRTGEEVLKANKELKLPIEQPTQPPINTHQPPKKNPAPEANTNSKKLQQKQKITNTKRQQNPNVRRNLDPFANKVNKTKSSNNDKQE